MAGVAQGLADQLRINVLIVRAAFVALTFAGGAGLVMYAAFWVFVPAAGTQPGAPFAGRGAIKRGDRVQYLAIGAITVGGVIAVQSLGLGLPSELLCRCRFQVSVLRSCGARPTRVSGTNGCRLPPERRGRPLSRRLSAGPPW